MGKKHFCFFQTAETGNRTPNSGVKGSGANHYPRAPARKPLGVKPCYRQQGLTPRGPTLSQHHVWSIFEKNNFGQTLHEINNIFQERLYINGVSSLFRQVYIPTGLYSDRSIFRQVVIPTGLVSDRSIFRQVDIPTGR